MKVTLHDEDGVALTEITSHLGRSSGQMLVDWATRPDALFLYYFDCGRRMVTLTLDEKWHAAVLGTRWQMGSRFWFLDGLRLRNAERRLTPARSAPDSGLVEVRDAILQMELVTAAEPRGVSP